MWRAITLQPGCGHVRHTSAAIALGAAAFVVLGGGCRCRCRCQCCCYCQRYRYPVTAIIGRLCAVRLLLPRPFFATDRLVPLPQTSDIAHALHLRNASLWNRAGAAMLANRLCREAPYYQQSRTRARQERQRYRTQSLRKVSGQRQVTQHDDDFTTALHICTPVNSSSLHRPAERSPVVSLFGREYSGDRHCWQSNAAP